jgi:hypothetical protein
MRISPSLAKASLSVLASSRLITPALASEARRITVLLTAMPPSSRLRPWARANPCASIIGMRASALTSTVSAVAARRSLARLAPSSTVQRPRASPRDWPSTTPDFDWKWASTFCCMSLTMPHSASPPEGP